MTLQELLGEELYSQVMEKAGDKHKVAIVSDGNWIPKAKFDAVNGERQEYKQQAEGLNKQLDELKGKLKDNDTAAETIDGLKQQIQDKETELAETRKQNTIRLEVLKTRPKDVADILPHIKTDLVAVDGDAVTGLKEQLETLKEEKPYLFEDVEPDGTGGSKGAGAKVKKEPANPWSKEHFNLTEQMKLMREDPEKAKLLRTAAE